MELTESPVANSSVPRYEIGEWRADHGVIAGITGRADGFDIGLSSVDSIDLVLGRWDALRESLEREFTGFVVSRQRDGATIGTYRDPIGGLLITDGLDGHATRVRGLALGVTVADCIPVYLLDPVSSTVAVLHAGWRGVAAGVLECGLERFRALGGARTENVLMHCGVGACGACYEVGSEVYRAVSGRRADGSMLLDLRAVLVERARSLGVAQVSVSGWCSVHDTARFHSHRASGGTAGRLLAYIGWPVT